MNMNEMSYKGKVISIVWLYHVQSIVETTEQRRIIYSKIQIRLKPINPTSLHPDIANAILHHFISLEK